MNQYLVMYGKQENNPTKEIFNTHQEKDNFCFNLINNEENKGLVINVFEIKGKYLQSYVVGECNQW